MAYTIDSYDPEEGKQLQILDKDGNLSKDFIPSLTDEDVLKIYKVMVLARMTDKKCIALQRQGRMVTYIPQSGQEAAAVASVYALNKDDWLIPSFREMGGLILRGAHLADILIYLSGNEEGMKNTHLINTTPTSIPIGSQIPHATGITWAMKLQKKQTVGMVFFGDGSTSEGDFHEGLNFAGVFKTPTIFFCMNNQWAISVPREKQTAAKTIAQKAVAYGFKGVQVDGNDIFAVHLAVKEAADRARKGEGPTLIEAYTYRQGPHTTADDPKKYRPEEQVIPWLEKDPIKRVRAYLEKKGLWNQQKEDDLAKECDATIEENVKVMEQTQYKDEDIFLYHYKDLTNDLKEQMEEYKMNKGL